MAPFKYEINLLNVTRAGSRYTHNQGIYVGLDIGTTSIKVIVAETVKGQMNVIGVGSQRSEGVSRGVIVDIDKAVRRHSCGRCPS